MSQKVRGWVMSSCVLLFLCGIALVINSISLAGISGGHISGGWWLGVVAILTSMRGFRIDSDQTYRYVCFGALITAILGIVATSLLAAMYTFYDSFEACASYVGNYEGNCAAGTNITANSNYDCFGNSQYYVGAVFCESSDQSTQCNCVTSGSLDDDSYSCYGYDHLSSCDVLFNSVPSAIRASYAFAVITLFVALFVSFVTTTAVYRPYYFDAELTPHETTATVVESPMGIIVTTTEAYVYNPGADIVVQPTVQKSNTSYGQPVVVVANATPA